MKAKEYFRGKDYFSGGEGFLGGYNQEDKTG